MGTQVLAGSVGYYKPTKGEFVKDSTTRFTVINDTCLEADKILVKFEGAAENACLLLPMSQTSFTKKSGAVFKDY